jgi:hypothetical protein
MLTHLYHDDYLVSPDLQVSPHAQTVTQLLLGNLDEDAFPPMMPCEPQHDPVLHLNMYILGLELDMSSLAIYAQKKFRKSMASDPEAFWSCIDILKNLQGKEKGDIEDKVECRLRHVVESSAWGTTRPFADLIATVPEMAGRLGPMEKSRFGLPY